MTVLPATEDRTAHPAAAALAALAALELPADAAERLGVGAGVRLRRAWPRGEDRLHLELVDGRGRRIAGQWVADGADLDRLVAGTARRGAASDVVALPERGLLLQARGADRRLHGIRPLLQDGGVLVSHRPERRAVVAQPSEHGSVAAFHKVVRPERVEAVVRTGELAAACFDLPTPRLLRRDRDAGVSTWSAVPGVPLRSVLAEPVARTAIGRLGAALAATAGTEAPLGLPRRDAAGEVGEVVRWRDRLSVVAPDLAARLAPALAELRRTPPPDVRTGPVHRDLHDGQVLVAPDGAVGLIDFDTLAVGDRAMDLGNLLGHLDLRRAQGLLGATAARRLANDLLDGCGAAAPERRRAAWYARATLLRLCCVYAFRPAHTGAVARLVAALTADGDGQGVATG